MMAKKVLIVDNSNIMRKMIGRVVSMMDNDTTQITEADNGYSALKQICRQDFDLVITGLNMPETGGYELIYKIRDAAEIAETPILVVSTESNPERIQCLHNMGVNGYLRKPFAPENLRDMINMVMAETKQTIDQTITEQLPVRGTQQKDYTAIASEFTQTEAAPEKITEQAL
jgi:two-component system chemotaxis response regulator CheY